MKARLIKRTGKIQLLFANGTISDSNVDVLSNFLLKFKESSNLTGSDGTWTTTAKDMSMYPGETLAYVADDDSLVVLEPKIFNIVLDNFIDFSSYISLAEYAQKHDKSREIIKVLCRTNRIPGAQMVSGRWLIPKDAPYPGRLNGRAYDSNRKMKK